MLRDEEYEFNNDENYDDDINSIIECLIDR